MSRWLPIILLSLMCAYGPTTPIQEAVSTSDLNLRLLVSHWTSRMEAAEARLHEIEGYVGVLRSISAYQAEKVPDSINYAIAIAIYEDSKKTLLPGSFYLGLIRVENPFINPFIINWYGAVGLTQVVPRYWEGVFPECGPDLYTNIYTQICYGARVYLHYLDIWEDETLALYAYNGCTEHLREQQARCTDYPLWVQGYAMSYEKVLTDQ